MTNLILLTSKESMVASADELKKLGMFLHELLENKDVDVAIVTKGIEKSGTKQPMIEYGDQGSFSGVQEVINYVLYQQPILLRTCRPTVPWPSILWSTHFPTYLPPEAHVFVPWPCLLSFSHSPSYLSPDAVVNLPNP